LIGTALVAAEPAPLISVAIEQLPRCGRHRPSAYAEAECDRAGRRHSRYPEAPIQCGKADQQRRCFGGDRTTGCHAQTDQRALVVDRTMRLAIEQDNTNSLFAIHDDVIVCRPRSRLTSLLDHE
jgi:hypothetical protein